MFVENQGILSGIDKCTILTILKQPLKLCWIQMQMGGAYIIVQHGGLNVVQNVNHFISATTHTDSFVWIS